MSNEIINDFVGRDFSFPYVARLTPNVSISANPSKTVRQSFTHDPHDWMTFTVSMGQLTPAQKDLFWDFILAHGGNADSFLIRDDYGQASVLARQTILTAAGGETSAQVIRSRTAGAASRDYEIWNFSTTGDLYWLNAAPLVPSAVNNVDDGTITFPALSPADVIEAELATYYRRVRFPGDVEQALRAFQLNDFLQIPLREEGITT